MRKFQITALFVLLAFASGCSLFGGSDSPVAGGPTVNPLKLAKLVVPVANNALQAVNAAPSRFTANDVDVFFKDAKTLANIALFGTVTFNANDITVTGEFKGIVVLVEIKSKTADKTEKVVLGKIADDGQNNYATVTTTVVTTINPATMLATRNLIAKQAGATVEEKLKALGTALDAGNNLATATADSGVNTVAKEAVLIQTAVATGTLSATVATDNGDAEILELLTGAKPADADLTAINTGVTSVATVYPTLTAAGPVTIAKKDVAETAGKITLTGTNFTTDLAKLEVLLGTFSVPDNQLTVSATEISFNLTALQAADIVGTALAVIVKQTITVNEQNTLVTLTAPQQITITPAVLQSIAITPTITSIVKEQSQNFVATGTYDDTTTKVITNDVTWTATHGAFSTETKGRYTAPNAEQTGVVITAALGAINGTMTFNVISSPLTALNLTDTMAAGNDGDHKAGAGVKQLFTLQLYAYGIHEDAAVKTNQTTGATWTSATPAVATVGANTGIVTGVANGTAVITAAVGAITRTITITVDPLTGIAVTGNKNSIKMNETVTLVATGTYTEAGQIVITDKIATWTAVKGAVANAVFTPSEPGAATVATTTGGVTSNTFAITVSADPIITNFTVTRNSATQATVTWTTAYAITGGVLQYSTKPQFGEGIDPFSLKISQQTGGAATAHTVVVTDITAATDDASTTTSIEGWRFTVGYQIGAEKFDSPLKSDGNVTIVLAQ